MATLSSSNIISHYNGMSFTCMYLTMRSDFGVIESYFTQDDNRSFHKHKCKNIIQLSNNSCFTNSKVLILLWLTIEACVIKIIWRKCRLIYMYYLLINWNILVYVSPHYLFGHLDKLVGLWNTSIECNWGI